jgi:hypothetical protein
LFLAQREEVSRAEWRAACAAVWIQRCTMSTRGHVRIVVNGKMYVYYSRFDSHASGLGMKLVLQLRQAIETAGSDEALLRSRFPTTKVSPMDLHDRFCGGETFM